MELILFVLRGSTHHFNCVYKVNGVRCKSSVQVRNKDESLVGKYFVVECSKKNAIEVN